MKNAIARSLRGHIHVVVTLLAFAVVLGAGPATAVAGPPVTTSVLVQRSGGLTGMTERFLVDRTSDDRAGAEVLRLTAEDRFRALHPRYVPDDPCCDRYVYTVVVHYADDSVKTVTTVEATPAVPPLLLDVIQLTIHAGRPVTV